MTGMYVRKIIAHTFLPVCSMTVSRQCTILSLPSVVSASAINCTRDDTTTVRYGVKMLTLNSMFWTNISNYVMQNTMLLTSTHIFIAVAAVKRTTASVPKPRSCNKCTRISQMAGLLTDVHMLLIHFPINQAIRRLTIGQLIVKRQGRLVNNMVKSRH